MADPDDAPVASASTDAMGPPPDSPDDRDVRRTALRDLAAMIGVEVFY